MIETIEEKVVAIYLGQPATSNLNGSGFCVGGEGLVLTAKHVIEDQSGGVIDPLYGSILIAGKPVPMKLSHVYSFPDDRDVAILKIEKIGENSESIDPSGVPFFDLPDSSNRYRSGDEVCLCGFPGAFSDKQGNPIPTSFPMVRKGIISSLYEKFGDEKIVILDLLGVGGFSGSPVVHLESGQAIGVFSKMTGTGSVSTGFSIAYPVGSSDLDNLI